MSNLNDENFVILSLIQALVGAVSPNFRRVMLDCRGDAIHIQFVLAGESQEDRDEISDVEFEFQALLPTGVEVETTVLVSTDPLTRPPHPGRVAFARRE